MELSDTSFAVALVTPPMQRIQKELKESAEGVFIDTSSHVDKINTAVTLVLCAGLAGALPLSLIFKSSQEQSSYIKSEFVMLLYQTLKEIYEASRTSAYQLVSYWHIFNDFCFSTAS